MFLVTYNSDCGDGRNTSINSLHRTRDGALREIKGSLGQFAQEKFDENDDSTWCEGSYSWYEIEELEVQE